MTKQEAINVLRGQESAYWGALTETEHKAFDLAIDALTTQQPRLMALEEFQASENNPKWLETKDRKHNRWTLGNAGYEKFYDNCMMGYLPIEEYGTRWRCWTARPTDEQRKVTPWDEPPKEGDQR